MINVKDIYDKANSVTPMSQTAFVTAFNEAVLQLLSRYEDIYVFENGHPRDITSIEETVPIFAEWRSALLHYVIYLKTGDALRKSEYDSALDYTYRTIWKKRLGRGKRYKTASWY